MSIVSIDASLTGLAVVSVREPGIFTYEEYTSKPNKTLEGRIDRYKSLADKVFQFISYADPELILIEGYAFMAKGSSVVTLGEFGGVLRYFLLQHGAPVVEVPPTTLKKFVTGKGNSSKLEVTSKLSSKYQTEFKTDNHADAFGLAQLGRCVLGYLEPTNKAERDSVLVVKASLIRGDTA